MQIWWMLPKSNKKRFLVCAAVLGKLFAISFVILLRKAPDSTPTCNSEAEQRAPLLTVLIRDFEDFENDIPATVQSVTAALPQSKVLLVADSVPYPPLPPHAAQLITLNPAADQPVLRSRPDDWFSSTYVLIVPDGSRIAPNVDVQSMFDHLERQPAAVRVAVWPLVDAKPLACVGLNVSLQQWTAHYFITVRSCDAVTGGPFAILMRRVDLLSLSAPFARPVGSAIFLQTALRRWAVAIGDGALVARAPSPPLFSDAHRRWKHSTRDRERLVAAYRRLGIKRVLTADGETHWFGCERHTARCFPTIVADTPDFVHAGRWTPPCCLRALRLTAAHVFALLDKHAVRYWLEGGSLLGAARNADIIPWDYDVDIGIYRDDIPRLPLLVACRDGRTVEDEAGFVWRKAPDGDFFRVDYSGVNRLHVDIFPFYSRNGVMTKTTWFRTHRQDTEFPEHFLNPLVRIPFVGTNASAPNNWRRFLELKFGDGVIENARYPNSHLVFGNT